MKGVTIDKIDTAILAELQTDASPSVAEIAQRVNLSQNACWRRIRRLEEEGVILRRVALLDPEKLDAGMTVFVSVRTAEHSAAWLEEFARAVSDLPEVVEFYRMAGEIDYLLKVRVADIKAYDRVYKRLIERVRLVDVSAAFAMEEIKNSTAIPLPTILR
ncbi:Lrp/AsnC family transcriptional regulator [Sphingomonas sanguinis]|jgi:Lrp/AsnC family transcriptional regulator|uniref:Lrp/AsnC family transcriptional regulator n=1 Tax=Sphingomonas sanguinis TaxID=33051 RepID=A0A7Y7UPV5_9SPHN|nr:Lrp/AsnC family transcriptional regulator [Sphingomonas sanguinis]MBZ6380938.1 Lrp/AsnC family transcriptional regulator [Sphingomonas sanguinis]NNG50985.1 Lrp/AsnC family transcriptional regulator [Sphingomonas sanguinis]NNG55409.1 Lrp/AsnC family transcriptional regulator [Sphingomonas sanguinis]NVP30239.1 Lrp/AsnC family transcriptional regulator [Sphingomonas sanguinis]